MPGWRADRTPMVRRRSTVRFRNGALQLDRIIRKNSRKPSVLLMGTNGPDAVLQAGKVVGSAVSPPARRGRQGTRSPGPRPEQAAPLGAARGPSAVIAGAHAGLGVRG